MRLKEIRLERGLTQQEVADYLGTATSVYSRFETGNRMPSVDVLVRLAQFYGVLVDTLIGYKPEEETNYVQELADAAEKADDRARADALGVLRSHEQEKNASA